MTDLEIIERVNSWNWNLNIFEIYDEIKEMSYGGRYSNKEDLGRLLTHAYHYFNMEDLFETLATHLDVELGEEALTTAS
jgi:hypothetical protein